MSTLTSYIPLTPVSPSQYCTVYSNTFHADLGKILSYNTVVTLCGCHLVPVY